MGLLALASAMAFGQQIVWDQGPGTGTIGAGYDTDGYDTQNFVDQLSLPQQTLITTYYFYGDDPQLHDAFHVLVYADNGGIPGGLIFDSNGVQGDNIGRVGADDNGRDVFGFAIDLGSQGHAFTLDANTTYWVGGMFTGNGEGALIHAPQDNMSARMIGRNFDAMTSGDHGGDLMFRLSGQPVPEPASLLVAGVGVLFYLRRRRCQ